MIPMCERETFWTLLRDVAHWEFEIFLILLIDGLLMGLLWPLIRKHLGHHHCPPE